MKKLLNFLSGKKTYAIALLVGGLTVLQHLGMLDLEVYTVLMGLLGAGGLASLRAGVNKR